MKAYKFRPKWDDAKYSTLLTDNIIHFASPRKFNDPFDCTIHLRYDLETEENLRKEVKELMAESEPYSTVEEINRTVNNFVSNFSNPDIQEKFYIDKEKLVGDSIGIFTLAGNYRSIMMWSHYGGSHSGFCIEYDIDVLKKHFINLHNKSGMTVLPFHVRYKSHYPILIPSELKDDNKLEEQVAYKFRDWSYEEEYRFIVIEKTNICLKIPNAAITGVILGCLMKEATISSIKDVLKGMIHKPKLMRAIRKRNSYDLQFEEMKY